MCVVSRLAEEEEDEEEDEEEGEEEEEEFGEGEETRRASFKTQATNSNKADGGRGKNCITSYWCCMDGDAFDWK